MEGNVTSDRTMIDAPESEAPRHPRLAAALLMIGIVALLVLVSALEAFGR